MALLELHNLSKQFPGVKALSDITLSFRAGEVHAVCGENGAGKSTLMHILAGNLQPDTGHLQLDGKTLRLKDPVDAFRSGISIVHQHLSLADNLSVAENIFADRQPVNWYGAVDFPRLFGQSRRLLARLHIDLDPSMKVGKLSAARKQMVEIAKALAREPRVLILDEPTAAVTDQEVKVLFDIIRQLKREQVAVIYISHRLHEVFGISDTITVLKDGTLQGTFPASGLSRDRLIGLMVGRELVAREKAGYRQEEVLLEAKNLSNAWISGLDLTLHKGEILGMAGLVGAGRTEMARMLFGADPPQQGVLYLEQRRIKVGHPADAVRNGIVYLPEDRKSQSLFPDLSVTETLLSASLSGTDKMPRRSDFRAKATEFVSKLRIAPPDPDRKVSTLSGGNQQKVFLAKWLLRDPRVFIVDEPTHGIDIGAKYDVYRLLQELAGEGKGVIVISSELPELLMLCDRILVIRDRKIAGVLSRSEASEESILKMAMAEPITS